jgi:hypothetical protein
MSEIALRSAARGDASNMLTLPRAISSEGDTLPFRDEIDSGAQVVPKSPL